MNKRLVLIICGASAVLVTLVLVFYFQFRGNFSAVSPQSDLTPTPVAEEMSTWTDPTEFTFEYPKSLSFNPHNEDQENYAHVELTSATHSGNLIVWVKDTTSDTIDAWVTAQKIKNSIDSTLGDLPAKKVIAASESSTLTLSTIRNGYLYQIEVNLKDSEFWNKTFDQVVTSFKFVSAEITGQPAAGSSGESGDDEGVSEEEEVIE